MYINLKDNDMSITRFVKLTFIQHRDGRAVAPSNRLIRMLGLGLTCLGVKLDGNQK